jgi:hypothetical protein
VSTARFEFVGLADFRAALRAMPAELRGEAEHVVEGFANGATATVKANYARGQTGNLIDGVDVEFTHTSLLARAVVKSTAKHAWWYENGTQVRHSAKGVNRGAMPPAPPGRAFVPVVVRERRRMVEALIVLLERAGLLVTGDGG